MYMHANLQHHGKCMLHHYLIWVAIAFMNVTYTCMPSSKFYSIPIVNVSSDAEKYVYFLEHWDLHITLCVLLC